MSKRSVGRDLRKPPCRHLKTHYKASILYVPWLHLANNGELHAQDSSQKYAIVRNTFCERLADEFSESEMAVMELIISNDGTTTPAIANALGVTGRGAQKLLSRPIDKGIVERTGAARSTRYRLAV